MTPLEEKMKYGLTLVEENGARWMLLYIIAFWTFVIGCMIINLNN